ncbi:MAG: hypothetical protein LUD77_04015 [Clostridiales bacterium]|nr:hypothetical protein [Clostridiales bacterium]
MERILKAFLRQFEDFTVIILIIRALLSGGAQALRGGGGFGDCLIILAILIINAVFGSYQELKAEKS